MKPVSITFVVNKKPYAVNVNNVETVRNMPADEREQLITVLEAIKKQQQGQAPVISSTPVSAPTTVIKEGPVTYENFKTGEEGKVDPNLLMEHLIAEDQKNQKPAVTKKTIHKVFAVIFTILLLTIILLQ